MESLIRAAFAEIGHTVREMRRQAFMAGLFGSIAALGALPLLCFAIVGLGILLGGKYWLSSLIIGGACIILGSSLAFLMLRQIRNEERELAQNSLRKTFDSERELIAARLERIMSGARGALRTMSRVADEGPGAALVTGFFIGLVAALPSSRSKRKALHSTAEQDSAAEEPVSAAEDGPMAEGISAAEDGSTAEGDSAA